MSGQVIEPDAHTFARERARDVNAQLLASRRGLCHARAGLVEDRAQDLEFVARPKLLVCHVRTRTGG
jgi:hypothetical protein